jgi:hypothetical protein
MAGLDFYKPSPPSRKVVQIIKLRKLPVEKTFLFQATKNIYYYYYLLYIYIKHILLLYFSRLNAKINNL